MSTFFSLLPDTYTVTDSQRSRKCGLAMTPTCVPAKPCVSSLVCWTIPSISRKKLAWFQKTQHLQPIQYTHARSTPSNPQTRWCHCGRWNLGDSNVLGEQSHPGFQIDHSDLSPDRLVWPASTKLTRHTSCLHKCTVPITGKELGQHVRGILQCPDFVNFKLLVLRSALGQQVLHLDNVRYTLACKQLPSVRQ